MEARLGALADFYGPLALPPRDLFAFFVSAVVSARTLPARRDLAWQALKRLPALTPDAMFRASKADLKAALEVLGGGDDRLDALKTGSGHFRRHRALPDVVSGPLSGAVRALCDVPHLTPASRLRALLFAGRHALGGTDDAVSRVVARLDGGPAAGGPLRRRFARRRLLADLGPEPDRLGRPVVLLAHHAAHACLDHAPHCGVCPLAASCAHPPARGGVS